MLITTTAKKSIATPLAGVVVLVLCLGVIGPRPLVAQEPTGTAEPKTFDVAADPLFKDYGQVVTRFAAKRRPKVENHFCIVGLLSEDTKSAWVLWKEGGEIILWEGGDTLDLSRRVVHLKADVVVNEQALHGSTFRVTKAWVDELTKQCERSGVKVQTGRSIKR